MKKLLLLTVAALGTLVCAAQNGKNAKNGALPGKFSVSAIAQVQFSQGNLQYLASKNVWRFAENQFDVIGEANIKISKSYEGWVDLFGWGTGNTPTNVSGNGSDYGNFADWGINAISNGGKKANLWRTLTTDEWVFLFRGRSNAVSLWGMGKVNGVEGIIILPDDWKAPASVTFASCNQKGMKDEEWVFEGGNEDHFSDNVYTVEQWQTLEKNGAVFLPVAGRRVGGPKVILQGNGQYWSATPDGDSMAYIIDFNSSSFIPQNSYERNIGYSVRLVR